MLGVLLLFAAGLAMLSTLAGDVTSGLATRTSLAPLLVVPVSVPLLLGAAQALESLVRGRTTLPWVLTLVVTVLTLAVTGVLTARSLEESNT
jgi:heme exporter protein B